MTDFDRGVPRRGSGSVKWDTVPAGVIPLSIADADWATAPAALAAARERLAGHPVFGYSRGNEGLNEAVAAWYGRVYGVTADASWLVTLPGVVPALAALARLVPGDALANAPNYPLLLEAPARAGKRMLVSPLIENGAGAALAYEPDFEDMARKTAKGAGIFYLCNPHNPTGHVYTRGELERLGDFARARGLIVVSDEIHGEIVYGGARTHTPFFAVSPENSVTLTSPGKIGNMPGMPVAVAVVPNEKLRAKVCEMSFWLGSAGAVHCAAGRGAYSPAADEWKTELLAYLRGNRDHLAAEMPRRFPRARFTVPDGTYLQWLDLSAYRLGDAAAALLERAKVALSGGERFGASGDHVRLNFACPRAALAEALDRLEASLRIV
ncbi:MAG: aminotransferase class I/II-fold pyridoxal phosphate-dependent enzyme [Gracilibacteraceae bacterium]|jgi:cystathionine beta-lyase|nr:aminotransferase class I/II-fold pyridoxal phosphate-dependent enzyme [Gracilibacteraceae bacterium]